MDIKLTEEGIIAKSLFKTVNVPFSEIASIVKQDMHTDFVTKNGEVYSYMGRIEFVEGILDESLYFVFDRIEEYNIAYSEKNILALDLITTAPIEEVRETVQCTLDHMKKRANEILRERLGADYELRTDLVEKKTGYSKAYLTLYQGGFPAVLPEKAKFMEDQDFSDSFESMDMFYGPVMYDPEKHHWEYALTMECFDEEACENTITDMIKDLADAVLSK